jgi:putative alpha-1,2-mannosidase
MKPSSFCSWTSGAFSTVCIKNYFDATDEPSQQIPFMYHYVNRPGLSTQTSRQVIAKSFKTTVDGLPGNDGEYFTIQAIYITVTKFISSDSGL